MQNIRKLYVDFPKMDDTAISVIPCLVDRPVGAHCHTYYEFVIITRGSCIFDYQGVRSLLMPGDVFLIEPHQTHSYVVQATATIVNCHFFPEPLGAECSRTLSSATINTPYANEDVKKQWDELLRYVTLSDPVIEEESRRVGVNAQGVIHLNTQEIKYVEQLLNGMMEEQDKKEEGIEYVKSAYLQLILVFFKRVKSRQHEQMQNYTSQKKKLIYRAMAYIEEHLTEKLNVAQIAESVYLSPNYFRTTFKDVTGLSPMEYMNRMRIVKSLEYLEMEQLSVAEAAEKVGIYDANYFSRMFKKVMGYSPRYFKKIN